MARQPRAGDVGLRDLRKLVAVHRAALPRKHLFAHPDLTYLFWEATLRCNLRCVHCGSSCEAQAPVKELDTSQILSIVDSIAADFDASRIFVSITGGEPLLRHDLYDVVARMTKHRMRSCIVTNGTLLGQEQADRLAEAGMRTVSISVDGMEQSHEAMRGKGTWRKTLAAFGHARKSRFRTIEALTCVRPANLGELEQIEKAVREAGATRWRLLSIWRMGRVAGPTTAPELRLDAPQVRTLLDFIERRRQEIAKAGDYFPMRFSCGGFLGVRRELAVRPRDGQCFAGLCIASILSDGSISACPSLPRSWAQGSALEERFSSVWKNKFKKFRDTEWRHEGRCEKCAWFSICLGGGLHERLVQPDDFCWLDRQDC